MSSDNLKFSIDVLDEYTEELRDSFINVITYLRSNYRDYFSMKDEFQHDQDFQPKIDKLITEYDTTIEIIGHNLGWIQSQLDIKEKMEQRKKRFDELKQTEEGRKILLAEIKAEFK